MGEGSSSGESQPMVKRLASETVRGLIDVVTIDDVKRVERKYQERACMLYLVLLLALLASFCLYVQERVSLRSNPQIATSIMPDKSFPSPNMVICFAGFQNYTWLGWGYDGKGAVRANTTFLDILQWVDDPAVAWARGRHCFFLNARQVLDTTKLEGVDGANDLVQTQTIAIAAAVEDVSLILDVTVALTDKTLAQIKDMQSISDFQNGGSLNQASRFTGFNNLMTPAEYLRISLTRRTQLHNSPRLWSRWNHFDRYDVNNFVHYRYTRTASGLEVLGDERYNSKAGTKATIYPVLPGNITDAERDQWRAHSNDRQWVMARTIPPILKFLSAPANLTSTIIFTQLATFHVLPVTASEDVDPLDLNDLISNLGGAWSVLLAIFGVFFVSTEWGTRAPIGPLRRRWWRDHFHRGSERSERADSMESGASGRGHGGEMKDGRESSVGSQGSVVIGEKRLQRGHQRASFAARLRHGFNSHLDFESLEHRIKNDIPSLKERVAQLEAALQQAQQLLAEVGLGPSHGFGASSDLTAGGSPGGSGGGGTQLRPFLSASEDSMVVNSTLRAASSSNTNQPQGAADRAAQHQ